MTTVAAQDAGSNMMPLTEEVAELKISSTSTPTSQENEELPAHRSHDPTTNAKRTDPFQFGQRYLEAGDNVFEFNAWDHVETDDAYKAYAESQIEKQRQSPVSDFDKSEYISILFLFSANQSFCRNDMMTQTNQCIVHLSFLMTTYLHFKSFTPI